MSTVPPPEPPATAVVPATRSGRHVQVRPPMRLLAALYVTQYIGVGFLTIGLVGILREEGTSLETLGLLSLLGLVWALKFLWAPLVDRFGSSRHGHYRSWLVPLQLGLVLSMLALIPFGRPAEQLVPVVVVVAVYVFFSATQDVAADALAVRLMRDEERGPVNGVQVSASYAGNVLGGGVTLVVYDQVGWTAALVLIALMTAVALVMVLTFREPDRTRVEGERPPGLREVFGVLSQPGAKRWALGVVPLLYVGSGMAWSLVSPAMVDAGWSLTLVAIVTGVVASVPAIFAGLAAGWMVPVYGRARVLVVGTGCVGVATLGLVPLFLGLAPVGLTSFAVSIFSAAYTVSNVVAYTVMMDYSRPATAGSDFTLLASIGLAVSFVAGYLALSLAAVLTYTPVALMSVLFLVAGTILAVQHLRAVDAPAEPPTPEAQESPTVSDQPRRERPVRTATVTRTEEVGPGLVRVHLTGEDLAELPGLEFTDHYVKLQFPPHGTRTYTVRSFDREARALAIDFVVHGDEGVAGPWARDAQPGDELRFMGPGGAWGPDPDADAHVLAGDESAVPAIAAALERLPEDGRAVVHVEVADADSHLPLPAHPGVQVHWVHRDGRPYGEPLAASVREAGLPEGDVRVFIHGNAGMVKALRRWLFVDLGLAREHVSISGYWRTGHDENGWQSGKREFNAEMEAEEADAIAGRG